MAQRAVTEAASFNRDLIDRGQSLILGEGARPDLIHCHDWFSFPAACALGEQFGIPVVGTIHILNDPIVQRWGELPDPDVRRQERELYSKVDAVITVSRSMRDITRSFYQLPDDRVHAVHNGFDLRPFMEPSLKPEEVGRLRKSVAAPDEKIVIFAGRLTPQKGISALFASAERVIAQHPKVRYLIIGEPDSKGAGEMVDRLTGQFSHLRAKVKLLGKVPRKQLAMLYQVANLAVVPSVYEPFGYAAIEAMAAGVPVVATRAGGLMEIIEDGLTGLLIPVHANDAGLHRVDVEELAAAQVRLLQDEALAQRISQSGRQRVAAAFSLEAMTEATLRVYEQTIASYGAGSQSVSSAVQSRGESGNSQQTPASHLQGF